ncbi:MAG: hypothetical protein ACLP50_16655 [Solirubrobacteraceae bacterium]
MDTRRNVPAVVAALQKSFPHVTGLLQALPLSAGHRRAAQVSATM